MGGTSQRLLQGLGALLVLGALIIGLPALLIAVAGNPIPSELPDFEHIRGVLSRPDSTGVVTSTILTFVAWIAWATFAAAVLVEIPARVRGLPTPKVSGLGVQQRMASVLVGAVVAMLGAGPLAATAVEAAPQQTVAQAAAVSTAAAAGAAVDVAAQPATASTSPERERSESSREREETHEYTVQRGDSLWRIAERELGDGQRYKEIADLNYGRQQPGGYSLDKSHWIDPGWVLLIPGPGPAPVSADETAGEYTVRPGDTLWDIAANELGSGEDYPRIMKASRDIVQPDGSTLSDPDQLQPGWTLRIPTQQASAPAAPRAEAKQQSSPADTRAERDGDGEPTQAPAAEHPEPAQEALPVLPPASTPADRPAAAETPRAYDPLPTSEPETRGADVAQDSEVAQDSDDTEDAAFRTAAGIGGLLAASLVGLLAFRRTLARRRRLPGQRIILPAPDSEPSALEADLRAVADPAGVEIVYVALRSLGAWHRDQGLPLPELRAARQSGNTIELFLEDESDLPAPWKPIDGRYVWRLVADDAAALDLAADASTTPAPYPSLVTVGLDEENANLLLDLEQVGCLGIRGDQGVASELLTALAVELGTSVWADDLQVTLVGTLPDLPAAIDNGRIRHVSSLAEISRELEARADAVTAAIEEAGATSLAQARGRDEAGDTWTPEILLVGAEMDRADRMRLEGLVSRVPRVGVAAVVAGTRMGEWVLDLNPVDPDTAVTPTGTLQPAGIVLRPQQLSESHLAIISELLHQPEQGVPGPAWGANLQDMPAPELEDLETKIPALTIVPVDQTVVYDPSSMPEFDRPASAAAPDLEDSGVAGQQEFPAGRAEVQPQVQPQVQVEVPAPSGPVVRVLGDVELDGATGVAPAQNHQRRDLEIIALLALHPEGVSTEKLTAAIWPNSRPEAVAKTRNPAISQTRRWLGQDDDGQPYFPLYSDGVYRLAETVTTDWDQFLALVGEDITSTPTEQLLAALSLIRGRPFKNAKSTRYIWADPLAEEIRAAAVDVAHEVASRALSSGDAATARRASEAGRAVDPADERGWRDGIRAEWAAGRREAAQRLVDQLRESLSDLDLEPEPETEHLLADLADRIA